MTSPTDYGKYYIMNCTSRTVIDLDDGDPANGTKIQGWDSDYKNGIMNQIWQLEHADNGYYFIKNVKSTTYMDLDNGDPANGTKIQGWSKAVGKAQDNQLWKFDSAVSVPNTVQSWYITNKKSGTVVNLNGGSDGNGTSVTGWGQADSSNERWILLPVTH